MTAVFLAHAAVDGPFAQRLRADLVKLGAQAWAQEAAMGRGDSLLDKISRFAVTHLAVVLSPEATLSGWVRGELEPALERDGIEQVLIYYRPCDLPRFLQGTPYLDFTDSAGYDRAFLELVRVLGLSDSDRYRPLTGSEDRHTGLPDRPRRWFCFRCGAGPMPTFNDYMCVACGTIRPFVGGSATMMSCSRCGEWNLAVASYCEWCGHRIGPIGG